MVRQLAGKIDGRRTVRTTDDTDGRGFQGRVSKKDGTQESEEDAKLCSCPQEHALGICDEGTKVCRGTHTEENKGRINAVFNTHIEELQKSSSLHETVLWQVHQKHTKGDGDEQIRFVLLINGQVQEKQRQADHEERFAVQGHDTAGGKEFFQYF